MRKVASTGFRDLTRLASGDATMNLDICLTNKEEVMRWIDRYIVELQRYRGLVEAGGEPLAKEFLTVQMERDRWVYGRNDDDAREDDIKSVSLSQMLLGDRLGKMSGYLNQADKKKR
jgi:prephenate dehydrogenase